MTEKDTKLLWGRAGNRCAMCRTELSHGNLSNTVVFNVGEQAHIVGEKDDSPRGKSILTSQERDGYPNRILLCPTHHTIIDKNEEDYPVEKLHLIKSDHELWVRETLGDSADTRLLAKQVAVTSIIDSAVELCRLQDWKLWTSGALAPDPRWDATMPEMIFEFRQRVAAAIWPEDFEELQRATITLSILLSRAKDKFMEHADYDHGILRPHKFYKEGGFNPNYHSDLRLYQQWIDSCHRLIIESSCAANWFADVVRRDINPMFFAEKGKFVVLDGPFIPNLNYIARIPEYSTEDKNGLPESLAEEED